MKRIDTFKVSIIVFGYLCGCATFVRPTVSVSTKLNSYRVGTVAVLQFDGYRGEQFADLVTQELLNRGIAVVERARLTHILNERQLTLEDINKGSVDLKELGTLAGVNVLVFGSVSPITVYESGAPSEKVSTASMRFVSVSSGRIISSASYSSNTDLLAGSTTYPKAAAMLIREIFAQETNKNK